VAGAQKSLSEAVEAKKELEAQLETLQSVTIPLNTRTVQSSLAQAKTSAATAKSDYQRQRDLLGQGYVAKADVEQSYEKLANAQAAEETAAQREQTLSQENALSIQQLKAHIAQSQSQIEQANAQVQQAQAALQAAQDNAVQDEVKREDYQAAQAAVRQAQAEIDAAKAGYSAISMKQRDVEAAQAEIGKDQAALREADTNLSYTRVVAPRDGVIIAKNVEEGTVVPSSRASIGSTNALLQIGDTSRMWVVCSVDETDIAQVRLGQAVSVKLDAYPDQPVDGKVIRIDPQVKVDQNVTTIPVTVEIARPDDRFKNGMNATCDFIIGEAHDALVVPNEALRGTGARQSVQILVDGKPERVAVQTGLVGKDTTEIRSGLQEGQAVITRTVRPQSAKPEGNGTNNPFASPVGGGHGGGRGGR
jgi:HlyD family secretion protein